MSAKPKRTPGPDHPISIEPSLMRVIITVAGVEIADSRHALILREASYPPVLYIPREEADLAKIERTSHSTYCPYKGDCSYYSIPVGGPRSVNAIWTYEQPYPAVAQIAGHLAFYRDRVDDIREIAGQGGEIN